MDHKKIVSAIYPQLIEEIRRLFKKECEKQGVGTMMRVDDRMSVILMLTARFTACMLLNVTRDLPPMDETEEKEFYEAFFKTVLSLKDNVIVPH